MADIESNIRVDIDTSSALASIKNLQRQISAFQKQMQSGSAANAAQAQNLQRVLINDINATGKFAAKMQTIRSTTENFTTALEKNKLSMGEYFRYGIASSQKFGSAFTKEFNTIEKVARERVKTLQTQYISLGRDASGALKSIAVRPLTLDMNDLGTKTAMAAQKQQIMNQLLKQGSTNLLNFGKNTQWAGRQLMVGFTIPLSILGTTASKTFMELEEQAIRFKRVYGDLFTPPAEADAMIGTLKALGEEFTKYGVAVKDTLGLAADAAAMGKTGVELTAQVTEATRLAVLGSVSQQQALETSISLTSAFGVETNKLASKIDFLNAVENQTVVSIEDLTTAIPKAGPVVKQLGGDVEDLAFFLTAMKEGGINASEGANALKSGLASLINPTAEASSMLSSFGVNIRGIVEANRGDIQGTVVEFAKALDTLDPLNRARAIEQMFGKFQFARISTLFQNVIAEGSQASRVLELTNSTTSQLAALSAKELSAVEQSTTYKFKGAIEAFQSALAPVGEEFLKLITPVIEFGTKVLKVFDNMSDGAKGFLTGMTVIAGGLAPIFLMTFGLLANAAANALKGFQIIRNGFSRLTGQSKILGEQTQYMTQEQLEANAVAASLEQSHLDLTQIFTSEAGAVDRLKDAYTRATQAAARFASVPAIPTTIGRSAGAKAKKYAKGGIIKGPGSGTSDSIAAMVSNGEFIVNAKRTKQYLPLLQAIASGEVPGFASKQGGSLVGSGAGTYTNAVGFHSEEANKSLITGASPSMLAAELRDAKGQILAPIVHEIARSLGATSQAEILSMIKANPELITMAQDVSEELAKGLDSVVGTITDPEYSAMFTAKLRERVAQEDAKIQKAVEEVLTRITTIENNTKLRIRSSGAVAAEGRVRLLEDVPSYKSQENGYRATASLFPEGRLPDKAVLAHLTKTDRISTSEEFNSLADGKNLSGPAQNVKKNLQAGIIEIYKSGSAGLVVSVPVESVKSIQGSLRQGVKDLYNEGVAGIKESTQQASPSKKAKKAGENIGIGAIQGIEEAGKGAKPAARRAFTTGPTTLGDSQSARWQKTVDPRNVARGRVAGLRADATVENFDKLNTKLQGFSFALSSVAGIATMFGGQIGEVGNIIFQLSGALLTLTSITSLLTTAKMKEKAATAIAGLGKGTDAAGKIFTGGLKNSFTNLKTVVTSVIGKFGRFIPYIGLAIAAFAAFTFISGIIEKQRQKIEGLGEAANLSSEKLKGLGELLGTEIKQVSYGQGTVAGTTTSGSDLKQVQEIIQGEDFKKLFETQIAGLTAANMDQAKTALNAMFLQLVSSGVDQQIVAQIIQQLATEAGKSNLDIRFASIAIDPANLKQSIQDLSNSATESLSKATGYVAAGTVSTDPYSGEKITSTKSEMTSGYKQKFEASAGVFKSLFDSLKLNFDAGLLTAEEFNSQVDELFTKVGSLTSAADLIPSIAEKMGLEETISKIKGIQQQAVVLKAIISGIGSGDSRIVAIQNGSKGNATAEDKKFAAIATKSLAAETGKLAIAQENANKTAAKKAEMEALNEQYLTATGSIREQILAISSQNDAYAILIANGWSAADSVNAVSDANFMAAYSADPTKILETAAAYRELMEATRTSVVKQTGGGGGSAKEKSPYEKAIDQLKGQRTQIRETISSYNKLTKAGIGAKEAFAAAKDPILAAAIAATDVNSSKWEKLLDLIKQTNKQIEKGAIKDLLVGKAQQLSLVRDQVQVSNALDALGYSYEQIQDILSDETAVNMLAEDLKDGKLDSKDTLNYLSKIKQITEEGINLKLSTKEGVESEFQSIYNKATAWLNAQKTEIELKFKVTNAADVKTITDTENKIAAINYQIDDYEAGLQQIAWQEEEVNKKYDDRKNALDKVQKINEKLARQQKSQLTIADALAQGDIAAAARAMQEAQAQRAQDAMDDQQTALEASRQKELAALVGDNNLTRAEGEAKIKDLKKQIFDLEEATLEPVNERIRLATVEKDAALLAIDAQIDKWDALQNKIDLAKLSPEEYANLLKQAEVLKDMFVNWDNIKDKTATLTVIKKETTTGDAGGSKDTGNTTKPTSGVSTGSTTVTPGSTPTGVALKTIKAVDAAIVATTARVSSIDTKISSNAKVITDLKGVPGMSSVVAAAQAANAKDAYTKSLELKAAQALKDQKAKMLSNSAAGVGGGLKTSMGAKANGGLIRRSMGSDVVPTLLTPGEFVIKRQAVNGYGVDGLKSINNGTKNDSSVYNYNLSVNVKSDANPDQIARSVMTQIKQVESQRIRGNRY